MKLLKLSKACSIAIFFLAVSNFVIESSPAYPFPIVFTQSDGTKINVFIKGDEFLNWKESDDGYTLLHNKKGDLEYGMLNDSSNLVPSGVLARNAPNRTNAERRLLQRLPRKLSFGRNQVDTARVRMRVRDESIPSISKMPLTDETSGKNSMLRSSVAVPTTGSRKLICILMNFTDVTFHFAQSDFANLFNQVGYNADGATGSVKDFFLENSYNQYDLTVDVVGPFTADYPMAYYGNNTNGNGNALMVEAINKANSSVNFADYDNDGNGEVDGVYILFAGKGEESGGGADAIWSHAGGLNLAVDNVVAKSYSCSPELRGNEGFNITRIGVISHEFSHVLGSPDFYDVDYETGGSYSGTGSWDIMAGGTWNNSGTTPAHHNPWTKIYKYGWASATLLNSPRNVTLKNSEDFNDGFAKVKTLTDGEFFMVENRAKLKFDSYIPGSGMIIYHVHKSVVGGVGGINATHPMRMYPVAQNATENPYIAGNYGSINAASCAWTGTGKTEFSDVSTPGSVSWSGENTNKPIRNISFNASDNSVSFKFMDPDATPPTSQASNFLSTNVTDYAATISWTRGSGDRVLVLARRVDPVEVSPTNGTSYSANNIFMLGQLVDPGTYVVYDGTGTSVTVSDLLSSSNYYFGVYEYNLADHSYLSPGLTGSITTTGCTPCLPTTGDSWTFSITNVSFGTLNNSTGNAVYSSYKDSYTQIYTGSTYNLSVTSNPSNNLAFVKAWIDWNRDCNFQVGEEYDLGSLNATGTLTKQIYVPINALTGYCTMRVRIQWNTAPTACGSNRYSESEDYLLKVVRQGTLPTIQASGLGISNIQASTANISWVRGDGERVVVLMKMAGAVNLDGVNLQTLIPDSRFLAGSMVGDNTYVIYDGVGTNVELTSLLKNKTYYLAVLEYNSEHQAFLTPELTGSFSTTGCTPGIPSHVAGQWQMYISNVKLNSLNITSTGSVTTATGYSDYTSDIVELVSGTTYPLTVKVYTGGNNVRLKAWIDWDGDCLFEESEAYDLGSTTSSSTPLSIQIPVLPGTVEGFYSMRIRTRYSSAPTPINENGYSEAEDYTIRILSPISNTWNGTTWSSSTPIQQHDVTLSGHYSGAGFVCNNLIVNAGKQLTISSGTMLVGKDLTLKSDATGSATLLNSGILTINGNISVEQYLTSARNWYMSSPFASATAPSGFTYYKYNELTGAWEGVSSGATLVPTVGYIVQATAPSTFVLQGSASNLLNLGALTTPILTRTASNSKPGFNLVGNPYPSYLNANTLINNNASLDKSLWFRTKNGSSNYVFDVVNTTSGLGTNNNGSGSVTGMVPPLQSFWIRIAEGIESTTLSFNNTLQLHQSDANLFRTLEEGIRQKLQIQVSNRKNADELILYTHTNASNELDVWDSPKISNDNAQVPEICSFVSQQKVAINGLQNLNPGTMIPIGFKTGIADTFCLKLTDKVNFDDNTLVILKDSLLNREQDITDGNSYTFVSDVANTDNRFYLLLKSTTNLTEEKTKGQSFVVKTNPRNQLVITRQHATTTAVVRVVNALGQLIAIANMSGTNLVMEKPIHPGAYVIVVDVSGMRLSQKFIF